ncbi:MAG: leucyl/phenylalanyl-tRNA--protein transferase [Verrucomicrobiia bacterium]
MTLHGESADFPDPRLARDDGLVAVGGDLSPELVLRAYRKGIFPWSAKPVTWWSPQPRGIIPLDAFHIPSRLKRRLRRGEFRFTFNTAFSEVVRGCASPAPGRLDTWITKPFLRTYTQLHHLGVAHSIETWHQNQLVGGLYGVALGGFFAGESMFHRYPNASSAALVTLLTALRDHGFVLFDTQVVTPHTARFGAIDVPRESYLSRLDHALALPVSFPTAPPPL